MKVVPLSEVSGPRSTAKGQTVKFEEYFGDQENSTDSVLASAVVRELKNTTNASYFEDEEEFLKNSPPQPQRKTFSSAAMLAMGLDRKVKDIEKRTTEAKSRIELSLRKGPYNISTAAYVTGGHSSTLTAGPRSSGVLTPNASNAKQATEENKWGPQMYQPDKLIEKEVPHLPRKLLRLLDRYVEEMEWEAQREAEIEADMQTDIDYDNHVNRLSGAEQSSPRASLQPSLTRVSVRSLDVRQSRLSQETAVNSQKSLERLPGRQAITSNFSVQSGVTSVRPGSRIDEGNALDESQPEMSDTLKAVLNDVVEAEIKELEKENRASLPPPSKVVPARSPKASLSSVPETHKTLSLRYDMGAHGTLDLPLPVNHSMATAPVEYPTLSDMKKNEDVDKGSTAITKVVAKSMKRYRPRASSRGSQRSRNQTPLTQWDAGASPSPPLVHAGRVSVQSSLQVLDEPERLLEEPKKPTHRRFVMKTPRSRVPRTHYVFKQIRKSIKSRATDYDHSQIPKKRDKKPKFVSVRDNGPAPQPEAPAASIIDQYGGWGFNEDGENQDGATRPGSTSPVKGRVSVTSSSARPVTSGTVMTRPGTSVTAIGHDSAPVPPLDLQALRPMQPSTAPADIHDRSARLEKREGGSGITRTYRVHTPKAPPQPVPYDELPSPDVREFVNWLSKTPRPPPAGTQHSRGLGSYALYELGVDDFKYMPKKKPESGGNTDRPATSGCVSGSNRRPLTARPATTSQQARVPDDDKIIVHKGGSKGQTVRMYPDDATMRSVGSVYWPWTDPDQQHKDQVGPLFEPIPGSLLQKAASKPRPRTTFQEPSAFDLRVMDGMASGQFIVGEAEYSPRPPRIVYNIPPHARPYPSPHLKLDMERRESWK